MQRIESYKPVFQEPRRKAEFSHVSVLMVKGNQILKPIML